MAFKVYQQQVRLGGQTGFRSSADDPTVRAEQQLGEAIGQAGGAVGAMSQAVANAHEAVQQEQDRAVQMEAYTAVHGVEQRLVHDPKTGFLATRGKGAGEASGKVSEQLDKELQKISEGLGNERQRNNFRVIADRTRQQFERTRDQHVSREAASYAKGAYEGALKVTASKASWAAGYFKLEGKDGFYDKVSEGGALIRAERDRLGWSDEEYEARMRAYRTDVYIQGVESALASGNLEHANHIGSQIAGTNSHVDTDEVRRSNILPRLKAATSQANDLALSRSIMEDAENIVKRDRQAVPVRIAKEGGIQAGDKTVHIIDDAGEAETVMARRGRMAMPPGEREFYDDEDIAATETVAIAVLDMKLDAGQITPDEYDRVEKRIAHFAKRKLDQVKALDAPVVSDLVTDLSQGQPWDEHDPRLLNLRTRADVQRVWQARRNWDNMRRRETNDYWRVQAELRQAGMAELEAMDYEELVKMDPAEVDRRYPEANKRGRDTLKKVIKDAREDFAEDGGVSQSQFNALTRKWVEESKLSVAKKQAVLKTLPAAYLGWKKGQRALGKNPKATPPQEVMEDLLAHRLITGKAQDFFPVGTYTFEEALKKNFTLEVETEGGEIVIYPTRTERQKLWQWFINRGVNPTESQIVNKHQQVLKRIGK